jgi:Fe2+ or Zn2+ uptake regulation protein
MSASDLERRLRERSLRVTAPRRAVLTEVQEHPHADTDTLTRAVRSRFGSVSHQTGYGVLGVLTDLGLLRRIQPAGAIAHFETRVDDDDHLDCTTTSSASELPREGTR